MNLSHLFILSEDVACSISLSFYPGLTSFFWLITQRLVVFLIPIYADDNSVFIWILSATVLVLTHISELSKLIVKKLGLENGSMPVRHDRESLRTFVEQQIFIL